ncbi:transmembrane protein, putative [Bodo saltans]|uniref:Transmembrane protein, putative n=1 Tax=Bodo saltans TaxID=75058 RepID=A0A0S4JGF7_BODSA|nr:transmembrane protein, putative [Bodo saltans]|eukprot:CUG87480.1 transmembrane protein, putative [Bodo saltans]
MQNRGALSAPPEQLSSCSSSECGDEIINSGRNDHPSRSALNSSCCCSTLMTASHILSSMSSVLFPDFSRFQSSSLNTKKAVEATCGSLQWCGRLLSSSWSSIVNSYSLDSPGRAASMPRLIHDAAPSNACDDNSFPVVDIVRCMLQISSARTTFASLVANFAQLFDTVGSDDYCIPSAFYGRFTRRSSPPDAFSSRFALLIATTALLTASSFRLRAFLAVILFGIPLVNHLLASTWFGVIRPKIVSRSFTLILVLQIVRHIMQHRMYGGTTASRTSSATSNKQANATWLSRVSAVVAPLMSSSYMNELSDNSVDFADDLALEFEVGICRTVNLHVSSLTWVSDVDSTLAHVVSGRVETTLPSILRRLFSDRRLFEEFAQLSRQIFLGSSPNDSETIAAVCSVMIVVEDSLCEQILDGNVDECQNATPRNVDNISPSLRASLLRKILLDVLDNVEQIRLSRISAPGGTSITDIDENVSHQLRRALGLWASQKSCEKEPIPSSFQLRHDESDRDHLPNEGDDSSGRAMVDNQEIPIRELLEADGLAPPLRVPKPKQIDAGFVRLPTLPPHILLQRQKQASLLELES